MNLSKGLRLVLLAIVAFLAAPSVSEGQQSKTIPQLCFLTLEPGTLQTRSPRFDAFSRRVEPDAEQVCKVTADNFGYDTE